MAGEEPSLDGAQVTSARKELKFDDKTGRFFETNLQEEECIPDEEFCVIDKDTGNRIRLTVAEKERMFLDALQVRAIEERNRSIFVLFLLFSLPPSVSSAFVLVVLRHRKAIAFR